MLRHCPDHAIALRLACGSRWCGWGRWCWHYRDEWCGQAAARAGDRRVLVRPRQFRFGAHPPHWPSRHCPPRWPSGTGAFDAAGKSAAVIRPLSDVPSHRGPHSRCDGREDQVHECAPGRGIVALEVGYQARGLLLVSGGLWRIEVQVSAAYSRGRSQLASSGVRGPKMRRSDCWMGVSLMLASRRDIRPSGVNSQSSLP